MAGEANASAVAAARISFDFMVIPFVKEQGAE
jgi:hypothetical protein